MMCGVVKERCSDGVGWVATLLVLSYPCSVTSSSPFPLQIARATGALPALSSSPSRVSFFLANNSSYRCIACSLFLSIERLASPIARYSGYRCISHSPCKHPQLQVRCLLSISLHRTSLTFSITSYSGYRCTAHVCQFVHNRIMKRGMSR